MQWKICERKKSRGDSGSKKRKPAAGISFVMLAVTVLAVWATEGDITIAVITVPLGLMCLFGKKMLIVDNYYFEAKKG